MKKSFKDLRNNIFTTNLTDINEGVYDPSIFKAFFLAGGPGSGKSYVVKKSTPGLGLKIVNSDEVFEKMLKDAGLETTPEDIFSDKGQAIRSKAKGVSKTRERNLVNGRLGLIIDGTGKEFEKISKQAAMLKQLGYDVHMIFVNTSLDVAQERNLERDRTLPADQVEAMWKQVQKNIGAFQRFFGSENFIVVDNNHAKDDVFGNVWKRVRKLVKKPIKNYVAKQWITTELEKKKRD